MLKISIVIISFFAIYSTILLIDQTVNTNPTLDIGVPTVIGTPTFYEYALIGINIANSTIYDNAFLFFISSWTLIGSVIWRGNIKKVFQSFGFDYDIFTSMLKMKGSESRIKILDSLSLPKNRKQIAEELNLDWKSVDRHTKLLIKLNLINEMTTLGNTTFYIRSEKGTKLLSLIKNSEYGNNTR